MKSESNSFYGLGSLFGTIPVPRNINEGDEFKSAFPEYISPATDSICILAINPFNSQILPSNEILNELKECGFNSISNELDLNTIKDTSDAILKAGLVSILNCEKYVFENGQNVDEFLSIQLKELRKIGYFPGIAGWYLYKNPKFSQLANTTDKLHIVWEQLRDKVPNKLLLIDLAGFSFPALMAGNSYNDYMNKFQENFLPSLWSYDFIPYFIKGGILFADLDTFYFNLEAYALRSKLFNRPFWATCHCAPFKEGDFIYSIPIEAYLRFETFSALAYGAKGIKFDSYFQPKDTDKRHYLSAPIDINGNKTGIWNSVQKVNKEITALNNIFFDAELIECIHTVCQFKGTVIYDDKCSFGPAVKIESSGIGFLISHLFSNRLDYMIVVNHEVRENQKIRIFFSNYWSIRRIRVLESGNVSRLGLPYLETGVEFDVPPGGYLIFDWR